MVAYSEKEILVKDCVSGPQAIDYDIVIIADNHTIGMDLKTASDLAASINNVIYKVLEKANSVPVVPNMLKALINLGKVSKLHYCRMTVNEDTHMVLYRITATFTDNTKREYMFECKFLDDYTLLREQLNYVNNTPIVLCSRVDEPDLGLLQQFNGAIGYNLYIESVDINEEIHHEAR
jgi:hypothetical protein